MYSTQLASVGLVQILKKCGYNGYIICRPAETVIRYPGRFFDWIAPDGSRLTVCRADSYGSGLGHAAEKIRRRIENAEDVDVVLWGVGNHGGGPSRKDLADIAALNEEGVRIVHSFPEALFADGIKTSGEITTSLVPVMPGCYTSMMRIKQAHRKTENTGSVITIFRYNDGSGGRKFKTTRSCLRSGLLKYMTGIIRTDCGRSRRRGRRSS